MNTTLLISGVQESLAKVLLSGLADQAFSIVLLVAYVVYSQIDKRRDEKKHDKEIQELKQELKDVREQMEHYRVQDNKTLTEMLQKSTTVIVENTATIKALDLTIRSLDK